MFLLAVTSKTFLTIEFLGVFKLTDLGRAVAKAHSRPGGHVQIDLVELQ